MTTVFDVLARDHQKVKRLLDELTTGPTMTTGTDEDDRIVRKRMADQLFIEDSRHEAAEEKYVWPVVRERVTDGDVLADEVSVQGHTTKEVLNRLDKLDAGEAAFEELLSMFAMAALQHIEFEETRVWPALKLALTGAEAEELGARLLDTKRAAPRRPRT